MAEVENRSAVVGYHADKGAKTFHLRDGDKLPNGYTDTPFPGQHPHDAEFGRVPEADIGKPDAEFGRVPEADIGKPDAAKK
jgi:hypothetical protein